MKEQKKVNEDTNPKIVITTTIPQNMKEDIKNRGWTYQELLIEGYFQRKEQPNWKERIRETEEKLARILPKLTQISQENHILREKIEKKEGNND